MEDDFIIPILGFMFIIIGIILSIVNYSLFGFIPFNNLMQINIPFLLIVFASILFIVSGSSIIIFYRNQN
ncbi:MAG: hypothetical protein WC867_07485 [Candidatus Pacearchaeota archaeon]